MSRVRTVRMSPGTHIVCLSLDCFTVLAEERRRFPVSEWARRANRISPYGHELLETLPDNLLVPRQLVLLRCR